MTRRGASLTISAVVALVLEGCSWIVLPEERQGWADRLAAAENNIKLERIEIDRAGKAAMDNQLEFISAIASHDTDYAVNEAPYDRGQVIEWSKSQEDATTKIKDIEQDMALLRDEIEEDGF